MAMNGSARCLQQRDNTGSQNMFLNIFFVHHNSTAVQGHLIFAIEANDREFFVSRTDAVASQRECLQCYVRPRSSWLRLLLSSAHRLSKRLRMAMQRTRVVRAADGCALSWLHRHRKPPPCSMGGCLRWDKYEPASSVCG